MSAKITIKDQYVFIHANTIFARKILESDEHALEYVQELAQKHGVKNMQALKHIGYGHAESAD